VRLLSLMTTFLLMLLATSAIAQAKGLPQTACFEAEVDKSVASDGATHLTEITTPALGGEAGDLLTLEFYAPGVGTFDLGSGGNANYASCLQCILAYVDEGSGPLFFQSAGSLQVNGDPTSSVLDAELLDVTLVEVTIDPQTLVSTPVTDGDCLHISSAHLLTDSLIFADSFEACQDEVQGFPDADQDGYGDDSLDPSIFCFDLPVGFVDNSMDCDDNNASVNPGAVDWFITPRSDGSFDYNCDGTDTKRYTSITTGCVAVYPSCSFGQPGWEDSVPACGQSGAYLSGCDFNPESITSCSACNLTCTLGPVADCATCLATQCPDLQICELEYAAFTTQECH
jgi:hypothetical protein